MQCINFSLCLQIVISIYIFRSIPNFFNKTTIIYDMIVKFKNVAYKKMLFDIYRKKFSQMFEYFHESRFSSNGPKEQYVFLGPVSRSRSNDWDQNSGRVWHNKCTVQVDHY